MTEWGVGLLRQVWTTFPATGSHQRQPGPSVRSAGAKPLGLYCHIESVDKGIELDIWSLGFLW